MENPTTLYIDHMKAWGLTIDPAARYISVPISERHESIPIQRYLIDSLRALHVSGTLPDPNYYEWTHRLFYCFQPAQAKDNPLNLAIYESKDKYDRDIRLSGKPGRIVKRLFPFASEQFCAAFAEWFKEQFTDIAYTVKESTDSACFDLAYSGTQSKTTNPVLSFNDEYKLYAKSLAGSCMRYDKSDFNGGLPVHPAEVYASGDFKIVWAEDSLGYIAGRCVVNVKQRDSDVYRPGPIYVATDCAFNAIASYMVAQGYDKQGTCERDGWNGARIKAIEYNSGYIAPYMDLCNEGNLTSSGTYFRLSRNGDYTFRETCGVIESEQFCCYCSDCGEGIREEDSFYHVESSGDTVCESCYDSSYFTCQGNGEVFSNDDAVEVNYRSRGRTRHDTYSQDHVDSGNGDIVYCESEDEYWKLDDVTYIECDESYVPTHCIDSMYFLSEYDSEYYPLSDKIELKEIGQFWTLQQAIDSDHYDIATDSDGNTVATLKCYLEVNCFGNVVNNQLEMALAA